MLRSFLPTTSDNELLNHSPLCITRPAGQGSITYIHMCAKLVVIPRLEIILPYNDHFALLELFPELTIFLLELTFHSGPSHKELFSSCVHLSSFIIQVP